MMQEEELVIRDENKHFAQLENYAQNSYGQDIHPFTISDGVVENSAKKYSFTLFELFVTSVVMLSTISGGFLEGYTSPALPSLLEPTNLKINSSVIQTNDTNSTQSIPLYMDSDETIHTSRVLTNETVDAEYEQNELKINSTDLPAVEAKIDDLINREILFLSTEFDNDLNTTTPSIEFKELNASSDENVELNTTSLNENNELNTTSLINESQTTAIKADDGIDLTENSTVAVESLPTPLPLTSKSFNETNQSKKLQITEEEGSWLGSLLLLGAALGAGVSPWVIRLGRRHAIMASAIPRFAGWILIVCSTSVYTFYAGRFLAGVSIGAVSCATPIYISEIAHPTLRGSLNCIVLLGVNVGIFISVLLGTFLAWKSLAIVGAVTVLGYFIPTIFIPNSPSWLVLRGRENEARAVLRSLRGEECMVEGELQQIVTVMEKADKQDPISWSRLLRERRTLLPLAVVLLVTAVNRLSGYNAIMTYCSVFINDAVPAVSEYWSAVGVCLVQMLATLGAMSVVDLWGRRKLLLLSVFLMGLSLVGVGVCESVASREHGGTWLAVIATMAYVGSYSLGVGPLTWVLLGELFPLDARDKTSAIVATTNWLLAFLVTKTYFSLEASAGIAGTCFIYASVCLVGLVFMYFLLPETKGRTLAEIEAHFSYRQNGWFPKVVKFDHALSGILEQEASYSTFH